MKQIITDLIIGSVTLTEMMPHEDLLIVSNGRIDNDFPSLFKISIDLITESSLELKSDSHLSKKIVLFASLKAF